MRARLALQASGNQVELREVVLRDKPDAMLEASPKGTVPVLVLTSGEVLEESLDIIHWSMENAEQGSDAGEWRDLHANAAAELRDLIAENDGPFKAALDAYKYPNRHPETNPDVSRENGAKFIHMLDELLEEKPFLAGDTFSVFDAAILPFVRQFAHVDQDWFYGEDWKNVIAWLDAFKGSERFATIMPKFKQWKEGEVGVMFGSRS